VGRYRCKTPVGFPQERLKAEGNKALISANKTLMGTDESGPVNLRGRVRANLFLSFPISVLLAFISGLKMFLLQPLAFSL
jgi:hypothetical protein